MVVAATIALVGCTPAPTQAPAPATPSTTRSDQVQAAAASFFAAARSGDRAAFQQTISARDPAFADRARLLFDNLRGLSLTTLKVEVRPGEQALTSERRQVLGSDSWAQPVSVTWQLKDDARPAEHTVWLTYLVADGRVEVAGTVDVPSGDDLRPQPIWWLGPVSEARQGHVTVLAGAGQSAGGWPHAAVQAAEAVAQHLPRTARESTAATLVVEVPATTAAFEAVVGAAPGTYAEIAAVTQSEGPTPRSALRIVVNPAAARRLTASGLAVTLTHEAVHVATRSPESAAPTWAVEGLADYVALVAYPDARTAVAEPLLAEVRRAGAPATLPADAAFAADAAHLDLAYAQAWSVCRYLAETTSPDELGRFYRALDGGQTLDQAAHEVGQTSGERLTAGWRRWLEVQARRG